jgi:hypothetical protein
MTKNLGAGLGDPYWYEWSVGQSYIIDMLDPRSGIVSVTLQKTGEKGLDDVVVRFVDGTARFIQVKHTRTENTLTFGDLVTGENNEPSLLRQIANAWNAEIRGMTGKCEAWLVTNRAAGMKRVTTIGATPISRPPLQEFFEHVQREAAGAATIGELKIPSEWEDAWVKEWLPQLNEVSDDSQKVQFLRSFSIKTSELELDQLTDSLIKKLAATFAVDESVALRFFAFLDNALRTWATSSRQHAEAITRETVYEKLCLVDDRYTGEHDLSPPAPFFGTRVSVGNEVASLLASRFVPIVFIVGEPGSGKTALLSWLANRRDSLIDIRFHAYRPITPENQILPADAGRTTNARALWSDLLLQIRGLARGRLAQFQVPVHARSLSIDQLRDHVLRLADAIGALEKRPFVIAIDGIDHAARAGISPESLLTSLVAPDQVPLHVIFLIGGQPPEGYLNYPPWLRTLTNGVKRIDIPGLNFDDTFDLVHARLPQISNLDQTNAARDVWQRCQGNTLSTVFAIEEAVLVGDKLKNLAAHLDGRKITSGIEAYYDNIWSSATRMILPATSTRLAASLCLMPIRTTAETVRAALGVDGSTGANLGDFLRQIRPLVVEDPEGFRVFHNDVRVFLHRRLQSDPALYQECASRLADHLKAGHDVLARQIAAQNLFGIAGRPRDQAAMYTPRYVLEGHTIGQSLDALTEQGLVAADALSAIEEDWTLAHGVGIGLRTLEQLRTSLIWRDSKDAPATLAVSMATRLSERRVLAVEAWCTEELRFALNDIAELHTIGERTRAVDVFRRWFENMSPEDIALATNRRTAKGDHLPIDHELQALMRKFGEISVMVGFLPPISKDLNFLDAEANFSTGLLAAIESSVAIRDFLTSIRRVRLFYSHDVKKLLIYLVKTRNWKRCKLLVRKFRLGKDAEWSSRLLVAAVVTLIGDSTLREKYVAPLFLDRAKTIAGATAFAMGDGLDQLAVMAWTSFLFGFEEHTRNVSDIREEIELVYCTTQRDARKDQGVAVILRAAAMLGAFTRMITDKNIGNINVEANVVARTVEILMTIVREEVYRLPHGFPGVAAAIVEGIAECSSTNNEISNAVRSIFSSQLSTGTYLGLFLETTWRMMANGGQRSDLINYADLWIGPQGKAWAESPADRHGIVCKLAMLLDELGENTCAVAARSRLPWADIGYTGHKEYALHQPLDWFEALAKESPAAWQNEGLQLLALSREASRTGDNRLRWSVEKEVLTAACIDGPTSIARITGSPEIVIDPADNCIVSGLIGMIERSAVKHQDILAIWSFCTGRLCWQADSDRGTLVEVREAILTAAIKAGAADPSAIMADTAPAEFGAERDEEGQENTTTRDYTKLAKLSVDDAMRQVCSDGDWKGIASVLTRIASEHPSNASIAIALAWSTLEARPERIWWYDGAGPAYVAIFPYLTPAQRWQNVTRAVSSRVFDVPASRAATLAENIDEFCLLAAKIEGRVAIQRGLKQLLDMHALWLDGGGMLPPFPRISLSCDDVSDGWGTLLLKLLFQLVAFDEQAYVQSALRGIHRLLSFEPHLYSIAVNILILAEPEVKRRFLLIAEAIACKPEASAIRDWLASEMASSHLDIALSAWSALSVGCGALGKSKPPWPAPTEKMPLVAQVARPLLVRPPTSHGLLSSVGRASTMVLNYIERASGDSVDDLRSELAASSRRHRPVPRASKRHNSRIGDMVPNAESDAELDRLFTILRSRERQGRFSLMPISCLAQTIVPFADPFIFLYTPKNSLTSRLWPIDDQLDELIKGKPENHWASDLAAMIASDLPPDLRLIAGTFRLFSRKLDVMISVDHAVQSGVGQNEDRRPNFLNGRSSLIFESPEELLGFPGARNQEWLTQTVGGLLRFTDATLDFFPAFSWKQRLNWEPEAQNPLIWTRDGRRVAWFERIKGVERRISPGDFMHRQPILSRWVCSADEWKRIENIIGPPQQRIRQECASHANP